MGELVMISNQDMSIAPRSALCHQLETIDGAVALFVVSCRSLKGVNRIYGHDVGDRILTGMRQRLVAAAPEGAKATRLTGAKFALVVPLTGDEDLDMDGGLMVTTLAAETLLAEMGEIAIDTGGTVRGGFAHITAQLRIGACWDGLNDAPHDGDALIDGAMSAHDLAQEENGTLRVCILGTKDGKRTDLAIARAALAAIKAGQASIALQPVVAADASGRVMFREALIRVPDEDGNPVAAGAFMPALDRMGMTTDADIAVLELAFAELRKDEGMRLSVNLSRCSIAQPLWADAFNELACADPNCAERLIIEVTEEAALSDCAAAMSLFMLARAHGAALALDDFGAGRTSFKHLKEFRFDMVKIDGSFISDIDASADNQMMVSALVAIAQQFDMMIVAEFVETASEARILRQLGVDGFQGYFFGRPALVWSSDNTPTDNEAHA
ncbi:MAG: bifunctional diguanylate cyclase/phosphodiesterase [Pseudomonadota bacterium]